MPTFLSPTGAQSQYFSILRSIKPSLNVNDPNSDFVIRGRALAGFGSGIIGDQAKINLDTWASTARPEALLLHGKDLAIDLQPATPAGNTLGTRVTGVDGTVVAVGALTFLYVPTNVLYTNTSGGVITLGILDVSIQALATGQVGNIKAPDTLTVVSPPSGVDPSANITSNVADGTNIESIDSYRARILSRKQSPPAGGNRTDYVNFAFAANDAVRSAFIRRFGRGLGTVDVYITSGTTDIDTAVTQGQAILRIPSPALIAAVQSYYEMVVPLTDCPGVFAPTEIMVDVTLKYQLAAGFTLLSVPIDATYNPMGLNCGQLIQREIGRALYKIPVGGRRVAPNGPGFVIAADIEASLDVWLSAALDPISNSVRGRIPILADREVQPLDPPNYNRQLVANQIAAPGTITLQAGV